MPGIIVMGAGPIGLLSAMLLARDGHAVRVLETDPGPAPAGAEAAWEDWERPGVGQFRQAHLIQPLARVLLDAELPELGDALAAAGALPLSFLASMPPWITDREPRPGDGRFETLTARRPVFEAVVAAAADAEPGVAVERGVRIRGLAVDTEGARPRVTGVHTAKGTRTAELVVDATGRRTPVPAWLAGLDAAPAQQAVDAGFVYYTRAYRGDALPPFRGGPLTEFGTFSVLTLPADNATWTVTLYGAAGDRPLKRVRDPAAFEAVVRACPLQAHWLDGEPLTGVVAMGGTLDRRTRYVDAAGPVATGIAPVGDAWACTNPSIGRGIALGALHAVRLRDMVRDAGLADLHAFALAYDAATEAELGPWYEETVARDHRRMAEMTALREGRTPDPSAELADAFPAAAVQDPDVYRAFLEVRGCLATEAEVLARPGLAERIRALTDDRPGAPPPGPDRDALLALVG